MQTATSKLTLTEIGGGDTKLSPGDTLENVVHHEIKELGQHVLACTVSYQAPQSLRGSAISEDTSDASTVTFRKFYKFLVTNPLSVKTKVYTPRSPSALMIIGERDKVFLEVHIQNLTPEPIWFERMHFEAVEGWDARDVNVIDVVGKTQSLYSGSTALMHPQDMRQYIYILSPKSSSLEPDVHMPGSIIPLGRLDICWRSSYGEPGRLLTSMLTRRIPLPPPLPQAQPASALPPYLKRASAATTPPPRPRSPQLTQSRPSSPTPRSASPTPYRTLASSVVPGLAQIPPSPQPTSVTLLTTAAPDVYLYLRDIPRASISVGKRFKIMLTLVLSSQLAAEKQHQRLRLSLVVQHLSCPPTSGPLQQVADKPALPEFSALSPQAPPSPDFSSPSPTYTTFNYPLAHQKLLVASQEQSVTLESQIEIASTSPSDLLSSLPPPYFEKIDESKHWRMSAVTFSGPSAIVLPPVDLESPESTSAAPWPAPKHQGTLDFELEYVPMRRGFAAVGGVRLLLIGERVVDVNEEDEADTVALKPIPMTLKEWNVVGEIWVP